VKKREEERYKVENFQDIEAFNERVERENFF